MDPCYESWQCGFIVCTFHHYAKDMWSHTIMVIHDYLIVLKVWKGLYEWILGSIGFGGLMVFTLLCFPEMKKICLGIEVCLLITLRFINVQQSKSLFLSIQYELLYCIFSDIFFSSQKSIKVLSLVGYKWKLSFGFWETRKQNGHLYMGPRNQLLKWQIYSTSRRKQKSKDMFIFPELSINVSHWKFYFISIENPVCYYSE